MFGAGGIGTPSNSIEMLGHNMLILAGQIGENKLYLSFYIYCQNVGTIPDKTAGGVCMAKADFLRFMLVIL